MNGDRFYATPVRWHIVFFITGRSAIKEDIQQDVVASVFGMFSFIWFGWAQESPKPSWRLYIGIASGIALLVCLMGVYLSVTNWDAPSVLMETSAFRDYLISFYAEFVLAGAGAFVLIRTKRKAWIAFIISIHFISMKYVFDDPSL
jgi:hypothetical protein